MPTQEEMVDQAFERLLKLQGLNGSAVKDTPKLGEELILITHDGSEVNVGQVISCSIVTQRSNGHRLFLVETSIEGKLWVNLPAGREQTVAWVEGPRGNRLFRRV